MANQPNTTGAGQQGSRMVHFELRAEALRNKDTLRALEQVGETLGQEDRPRWTEQLRGGGGQDERGRDISSR